MMLSGLWKGLVSRKKYTVWKSFHFASERNEDELTDADTMRLHKLA